MKENEKEIGSNRRTFLKTAAAISGVVAVPASTTAAKPSEKKKQRAEQRRYEALAKDRIGSSIEAFHDKLRKNNFEVFTRAYGYRFSKEGKSVQKNDSGGVSTMSGFPEDDLTATVSLYEGRYNSYADLDWTVDTEGWEGGAPPKDNITLGWSDNQYLYNGESHSVSDGSLSLRTRDASGAVWMWDDEAGQIHWEKEEGYVTAYLDPQGDCNTRHVYGTYEHTWSDVSINSISFGAGGVSIVYSDETKRWKVFPSDEFGGTC